MTLPHQPTVYTAPREWTRVHPVSPYLGSGPVLGFIAVYAIARMTPSWVAGDSEEYEALDRLPFVFLAGGTVLVIALIIGFGVLSWRRNDFRIGDDAMYHRKGILFRQHRQARLDRIEAVDVVQPLLARLFSLARLDVQVAGGRGSGIALSFLRLGEAEALRNEVLALAAGAKHGPDAGVAPAADAHHGVDAHHAADAPHGVELNHGAELSHSVELNHGVGQSWAVTIGETHPQTAVPAAPERDVLSVPTGRLLASVALSTPTIAVALAAVGLVVAATIFGSVVGAALLGFIGTSVFAIIGFAAAILSYFWNQINGGFHFTASTSSDGLRLRHGLAETRRQTVTPGRVQAVLVRQPWLWRLKGWYRVTMNVAGYQEDQERVSTLLPVGTLADVQQVLELVLPEASGESLSRAVTGRGGEDAFTPSPKRARLMDPFQWRQRGVRAAEHALFIRSGRLTRDVAVVPHARTQSLGVTQGPLQRARHLATFAVHSTPGRVSPVAKNLDADAALDLLDQQSERARAYRLAAPRG